LHEAIWDVQIGVDALAICGQEKMLFRGAKLHRRLLTHPEPNLIANPADQTMAVEFKHDDALMSGGLHDPDQSWRALASDENVFRANTQGNGQRRRAEPDPVVARLGWRQRCHVARVVRGTPDLGIPACPRATRRRCSWRPRGQLGPADH